MTDRFVNVATFRDLPEALLAKGRLDSAGIECQLADDNLVRLDWFWANAVGGIKLQVAPEDFENAREMLASASPAGFDDAKTGEHFEQPRCPRCQSLDISFGKHDAGMKLLALQFFGLPLPSFQQPHWKCDDCGARWVEEEEPR
jgi:Putative prokaryotic signal transducing protein